MKYSILVAAVALVSLFLLYGCPEKLTTGDDNSSIKEDTSTAGCPAHQGEVLCSYCPKSRTDSPLAGKCLYCYQGYGCPTNPCDNNCIDLNPASRCPVRQGQTFCGYCSDDPATNPAGGKCRYCDQGYSCSTNVCAPSEGFCKGSGGGGGGGGGGTQKIYYASCNQCQYSSGYSYRGYSYETCNAYYQACVYAQCGKILDNCR